MNVQVDDYINKFKVLSLLDHSKLTDEERKEKEDECDRILLELIEKVLESAKYELRVGWALSIFEHLRTAGIAGVRSIAKIMKGSQ